MTKEALKMAMEALEGVLDDAPKVLDASISGGLYEVVQCRDAITAIKEALAQPEPVKIAHKHEWFRTGEMKVGQMRCISCGTWGQEEMPKRTWVGLTDEEIQSEWVLTPQNDKAEGIWFGRRIEAKLKEKNNG
jgi:hypothetical protein